MRQANVFNLPGGMYGLVTEDVYADLLGIAEFVDYDKTGNTSKLEQGLLGRIGGMEIYSRNSGANHIGVLLSAAGAKLEDVATAATDRPVSIFWHEAMVSYGEASAMANVTPNATGYNGATILEAWKRFGAEIIRTDEKGVVALAEVA